MNSQKANPYNSDTLQALLDIRAAIERQGTGLTDINDILDEYMQDESELRTIADQINHSHKYPEKSIEFSQSARYDQKALFYELPRGEQVLFNLMCDIQDPQTGYVTVIKHMFVKVLRFTDTERKHLQSYLDDLTEKGFLICHYRPTNKKPGEYQVNQAISWIGKRDKRDINRLQRFKPEYTIGKATVILEDGKKATSGTLQIIDLDNIKKGVSAGHTDSKSKPHIGSEPQDDSNPNKKKNQDSVINMQNNNALTPDEESLFDREDKL